MNTTKKQGFTLIELLVVIAIIAILAAILFPVFAQAREKARQTMCLSNEQQIGLAVVQYLEDFDEVYPLDYANDKDAQGKNPATSEIINPYLKTGTQATDFNGDARGGVFACPSFPAADGTGNQAGPQTCEYHFAANTITEGWIVGQSWDNPLSRAIQESQIQAPSRKIMMWEGGGYVNFPTGAGEEGPTDPNPLQWGLAPENTGAGDDIQSGVGDHDMSLAEYNAYIGAGYSPWPPAAMKTRYRHSGMGNMLYDDGHVKAMRAGQLNWCRDIYNGIDANAIPYSKDGNASYNTTCAPLNQ
jgi:prepilin-type N-terminal cleavage/methylation domain-containing protein/prepilin-type processing-associated H-X9-DG protein